MTLTYNLDEAAALIGGVTRDQLNQWLKAGKMAGHKVGRQWRLTQGDIDEFLAAAYVPATQKHAQVVTEFSLTRRSRRSA